MAPITEQDINTALSDVRLPGSGDSLASSGRISGLVVKGGHVQFSIEIEPSEAEAMEPVRKSAEQTVREQPGVLSATVVLAAHRSDQSREAPPPRQEQRPLLPQVGSIVAVSSGKGGVGKSTTAANLALSFRAMGLRTALLDADIYGPSVPTLMGITGRPSSPDGKIIIPMEAYGVTCMSIGFMIDVETPMIWRGPMVMGALEQMMRDVQWGPQDVLVVDMPPGTGDVQLTMAQRVPLAGAIVVSTPQDLALIDARKGLNMFRKVDVPVLGIVENMSYFICPHCGSRSDVFTHGGARTAARKMEVPFLGEIPLDMVIRQGSDDGHPIAAADPDGDHARAYRAIAELVWKHIGTDDAVPAAPDIVFE